MIVRFLGCLRMKLIISGVQLSLFTKHLHSFVLDFDIWLGGRVKETNNPHTLTKAFYLFISVEELLMRSLVL